ncbi:hypothetical protein [Mycobacteroides abscessus]|uniref:hypothetical protein n=1 Tax=Mycobacteroides abscessus TaxID=36809 RepID=UPI0002E48DD4|nr:hypothetical protein [Mycobacteroides abscessus]
MSDDAWADLPQAIELLSKHKTGPYPFHCEHDELFVMSNPAAYTAEELAELDALGFLVNEDGGFSSFRYGSA